jgi:flagellar biosynthesis/type III secretory pathway M-ring protein FliF/YscJ
MPVDPTTFTQAGPLGVLLFVALAIWYAAREWTKGRRIDVDEARAEAAAQKARADQLEDELNTERDRRITESRAAHQRLEDHIAKEYALREYLRRIGVDPDEVTT